MNFCKQLDSLNVNYDICTLGKNSNKFMKVLNYLWFYINTFIKCLLGNYDLIYVHYPSMSAQPVLMAKKLRNFSLISNVHGTDVIPLKLTHQKMEKYTAAAIQASSKVVVPSEYYAHLISDTYNKSKADILVYPSGGVNPDVFYQVSDEARESYRLKFGINPDKMVIGFVGRIFKAKGWDIFLDALEIINNAGRYDYEVLMVGSGEDDEECAERIEALPKNLKKSIHRFPLLPQEDLAKAYNAIDIFVFPTTSKSESLGLVAIEAMACGIPVIASDYAAPAYYVNDGVNGYKFEMGNKVALAEKIEKYCRDSDATRQSMKEKSLETSYEYRTDKISNTLRTIFE